MAVPNPEDRIEAHSHEIDARLSQERGSLFC